MNARGNVVVHIYFANDIFILANSKIAWVARKFFRFQMVGEGKGVVCSKTSNHALTKFIIQRM